MRFPLIMKTFKSTLSMADYRVTDVTLVMHLSTARTDQSQLDMFPTN